MINHIPFAISCVITGIILFQSFFIAPSINKLLTTKEASKFLRYIWPVFFITISILSMISLIAIYYIGIEQITTKYLVIISFALMSICYFVTPLINNAKDTSNNQLWKILHLLTVILTLITLIVNVLIIIYWKFNI